MSAIDRLRQAFPEKYEGKTNDEILEGVMDKHRIRSSRRRFEINIGERAAPTAGEQLGKVGQALGQGASFAFGDELASVVGGGLDAVGALARGGGLSGAGEAYKRGYDEVVGIARRQLDEGREDMPLTMGAAEMAGGLATTLGAGGLAKTAAGTAMPRGLSSMAKQGVSNALNPQTAGGLARLAASEGALYGAGAGEGNRLRGAAIGAAAGLAAPLAMGAGGAGLSALAQKAGGAMSNPALRKAAAMGLDKAGDAIGTIQNPGGLAGGLMIGRGFANIMSGNPAGVADMAAGMLLKMRGELVGSATNKVAEALKAKASEMGRKLSREKAEEMAKAAVKRAGVPEGAKRVPENFVPAAPDAPAKGVDPVPGRDPVLAEALESRAATPQGARSGALADALRSRVNKPKLDDTPGAVPRTEIGLEDTLIGAPPVPGVPPSAQAATADLPGIMGPQDLVMNPKTGQFVDVDRASGQVEFPFAGPAGPATPPPAAAPPPGVPANQMDLFAAGPELPPPPPAPPAAGPPPVRGQQGGGPQMNLFGADMSRAQPDLPFPGGLPPPAQRAAAEAVDAAPNPNQLEMDFGPPRDTRSVAQRDITIERPSDQGKAIAKLSDEDLADLIGAPDGSKISIHKDTISAEGPDMPDGSPMWEVERELVMEDGELVLRHAHQQLHPDARGGLGSKIFARQADAARRLGVDRIETYAAGNMGDDMYNGYYTWPRLGFEAPLLDVEKAKFGVENVQDVMSTPAGRANWRREGGGRNMSFELQGNPSSLRTLRAYQEERAPGHQGLLDFDSPPEMRNRLEKSLFELEDTNMAMPRVNDIDGWRAALKEGGERARKARRKILDSQEAYERVSKMRRKAHELQVEGRRDEARKLMEESGELANEAFRMEREAERIFNARSQPGGYG